MSTATEMLIRQRVAMMRIEMITAGLRDQLLSSLHGWLKVEGDAILIMEEARKAADAARAEIIANTTSSHATIGN